MKLLDVQKKAMLKSLNIFFEEFWRKLLDKSLKELHLLQALPPPFPQNIENIFPAFPLDDPQ